MNYKKNLFKLHFLTETAPNRQNAKFSTPDYPYVRTGGNSLPFEPHERDLPPSQRCTERLETALEQIRRRQVAKQKTLHLNGYSLHQQMRSAPYDMYVTDMRVRLPPSSGWVCSMLFNWQTDRSAWLLASLFIASLTGEGGQVSF